MYLYNKLYIYMQNVNTYLWESRLEIKTNRKMSVGTYSLNYKQFKLTLEEAKRE